MNLAHTYALALKDTDIKKVVAYMKAKGHLSLLPQILRIMERSPQRGDVLTVAKEEDIAGAQKRFPEAEVSVDPRIVGGFLLRKAGRVTDATYRKALVNIYTAVTHPLAPST